MMTPIILAIQQSDSKPLKMMDPKDPREKKHDLKLLINDSFAKI